MTDLPPIPTAILQDIQKKQEEGKKRVKQAEKEVDDAERLELAILLLTFQWRHPDLIIEFKTDDDYSLAMDVIFYLSMSRNGHSESKVELGDQPTLQTLESALGSHPDYLPLFPQTMGPASQYQLFRRLLDLAEDKIKWRHNWNSLTAEQRSHTLDFSQPIEWQYWFSGMAGQVRAEAESLLFKEDLLEAPRLAPKMERRL